jgi:CHAD domain-containing protein
MKHNSNHLIGEFLFRFYRKRTASFLANIYKAGITGTSKDIHRARLDVKKIIAILELLRIIRSKEEKDPGYERVFQKLYHASGRIREIQVNQLLLTRPEFSTTDLTLFNLDLQQQEKERTREFLQAIRKFDEKKLGKAEDNIRKAVYEITPRTLQKKTNRYIKVKMEVLSRLFEKGHNEKGLHKIRQHLKELSTILTLVYSVKPSGKIEQAIDGLNKTEMMIGNWHDKVVLADSLENFLERAGEITDSELAPVRDFHRKLKEENHAQIESLISEIKRVIEEGFPTKDSENT